jgi:alkylation response protein AidB-like acyl-CoA dehydrogenase
VDFQLSAEQQRWQVRCRELSADFATRAAQHDRGASHPIENYERLREAGFLALTVANEWGGSGAFLITRSPMRCSPGAVPRPRSPSTCMPRRHAAARKRGGRDRNQGASCRSGRAPAQVDRRRLFRAGHDIADRCPALQACARREKGGYRISGCKMFALMLEAADFVLVMAYPEGATNPAAGIILLLPREAEGRRVDAN